MGDELVAAAGRYVMPPSSTMLSRGATSKPASRASLLVTEKRVAGSKFMSRSKSGDVVVDLPGFVNLVLELMVPRVTPKAETVEEMLVISNGVVKGFARDTVT
jgi:hypothetical protein